ncbi:hypothetical protein O9929_13455 [Vibrio lentus]|nr:hypothetical protein [Vibrio lentus]
MFGCGCVIYIHHDVSEAASKRWKRSVQVVRGTGNYDGLFVWPTQKLKRTENQR